MTTTVIESVEFSKTNWSFELTVCWIGLICTLALLLHAWAYRGWKPALLGTCISLLVGLLFTPWTCFAEISSTNPDVLLWNVRFRAMTIAWITISLGSFLSLSVLLGLPARNQNPQNPRKFRSPANVSNRKPMRNARKAKARQPQMPPQNRTVVSFRTVRQENYTLRPGIARRG